MRVVDIRLVAADEQAAKEAMAYLMLMHGGCVVLRAPRQGRKGKWLVYGTLRLEGETDERDTTRSTRHDEADMEQQ
jgi:hypothetical protein